MPTWERNTPWRQGQLLQSKSALQLGLAVEGDDKAAIVIITHDCDLAQSVANEPDVEVIVGRFVDEADGSFTHCKNLRRLHVEVTTDGGGQRWVELLSSQRFSLPKESPDNPGKELCGHQPDAGCIAGRARDVLQHWLAARYKRAAFPEAFDARLKSTGVYDRLCKALKDTGQHIPAIFFDVDGGSDVDRTDPDDVYELTITLLFSVGEDPAIAEDVANQLAVRIQELFESRCKHSNGQLWLGIELCGIDILSEHGLTYAQSMELKKWQADHISFKSDPAQPVFS